MDKYNDKQKFLESKNEKQIRKYQPITFFKDISIKLSLCNHRNDNNIEDNLEQYLLESSCIVGSSTGTITNKLSKILKNIPYGTMILFNKANHNYDYGYCKYMKKQASKIKTLMCDQYRVTYDDNEEWLDYSFVNIPFSEKDLSLRWTETIDNFLILGDVDIKNINGKITKKFIPKRVWFGYLNKNYKGLSQNGLLIDNNLIAETYMNHWISMLSISEPIEYSYNFCCFC